MAQKTLLQLIQTVAAELNLPVPQGAISATDQNVLKLLALTRATCDDLLAEYDWQQLQTRYTFTTTAGVDSYALPADMERFINGTFFDQNNRWPLRGPKTPSEWEWLKVGLSNGAPFQRFRIYGNLFYVFPTPGATPYTFVFEYIANSYVRDAIGRKMDFTQDSDICLFDHRLVIYGVKLKWKASISQDTTEALADYVRALNFSKGSDSPAPRLSLAPMSAYPVISNANYPDGSWAT